MEQSNQNAESSFAEALEASLNFKTPQQGDTVKGTVVSISGDDAYIAYGGPTEAVIELAEIPDTQVGDTVEATIVQTSPEVRVSRKMLARRASVQAIRQAYETRLPVQGKIGGRNKGGFDVSVGGVRAFCPLSQIALGKIEDPDSFIGQSLEFLVTEMSEDGRRLVVSRAALLKEQNSVKAEELRKQLEVDAVFTGRVRTIVPFGAFIDLGGIEGLLHVSEMSRKRVNDPNEMLKVGDEVEVKVIRIEKGGKRISLSMKELEPDPWEEAAERFEPGQKFTGTVLRKADFGLFVELEPGLEGLIHLSQLPFGMKLDDAELAPGSTVTGWVREVDSERKRLSLALREVATNDPWDGAESRYAIGSVHEAVVERSGPPGVFVSLEPGMTGLIPASELAIPPGSDASKVHEPGQKLPVKVISIDAERRRIALSHEGAKHAGDHREYLDYVKQSKTEAAAEGKSAMALALEKALGK